MLWSFPMVFGRNSLVYDRFSLFLGSKTSKVTLGYAKGSKKGSSEKNEKGGGKSKKMNFFKTAQNAVQYDFLVFLSHFMVIFYGFWSEFASFRTIFTLFGSKNVENHIC